MKKKIKKAFSKRDKEKVNFIFECRALKYLPRSCFTFLKNIFPENVAEHTLFVCIISWILSKMEKADENKVIKMSLIHDLAEIRAGERNLINKFYSPPPNEVLIFKEIVRDYSLENMEFLELFKEFCQEKTPEAKIVKDADILAQMLLEKESFDLGNFKAKRWLSTSLKRLETESAKKLGEILYQIDSDEWWLKIVKKYILFTKFLNPKEPFFHLP
jgi:5'-deoxynucleotidase YfbR-like HD superfamily hydrolase